MWSVLYVAQECSGGVNEKAIVPLRVSSKRVIFVEESGSFSCGPIFKMEFLGGGSIYITTATVFSLFLHIFSNWLAVGDAQSRVRLLYCTGFPICPPIILDSVPQHLATTVSPFSSAASISFDCSTNPEPPTLLATVTASGRLTVFSLPSFLMRGARPTLSRSLDAVLPSVLVETRIEARSGVASLEFPSSFRHPVVRLHSGSCLLFHTDRRIWIELFSGEASGSAVGYKMRVAVSLSRISPPGPLAAMQRFGKLGKNFEAAADAPTTTPAYRRALKEFLEAQVQLAELFGSPAEFKFWLLRWFRHLIENGG